MVTTEEVLIDFNDLKGKILTAIRVTKDDEDGTEDSIIFTTNLGDIYMQTHLQDCCEYVHVYDICGDLNDLLYNPLLLAEEIIHEQQNPEGVPLPTYIDDSFTWTFYKLATIKGNVTIRWYGSSNGPYSEKVLFFKYKA